MHQTNIIIGAGVVGLAMAAELSRNNDNIILVERHSSFGQETSSRSSEVIHAGIYYQPGSLKARLCVEGSRLLYEYCAAHNVPHRRIGKWLIANTDEQIAFLENLLTRARENGLNDLAYVSRQTLDAQLPALKVAEALHSPSTGIIDSHALMKQLEYQAQQQGVLLAYNSTVTSIEKATNGYNLSISDADGETTRINANTVINCAGLGAHDISAMLGLNTPDYAMQFWKGEFYKATNRKAIPSEILLYPVQGYSIGVHSVVDMQGEVKLGPLSYRMDPVVDYSIDRTHRQEFYDACKPFFPYLELDDLVPDMAGISVALQDPRDDWHIAHEIDKGLPGFINLVGTKSPALTSCLAIARHVAMLLERF